MNRQAFETWCNAFASSRPLIMGVLNITPNSFSDGGEFQITEKAIRRAMEMINQGVDIIDIGGEASNPYGDCQPISVDEELSRVLPVIKAIRARSDVCMSIDTCKAQVMLETVAEGVSMINDIMALQGDNALAAASSLDVPVCLMHMQGRPETMQLNPSYDGDVITVIQDFFAERIQACVNAGIDRHRLILDPGIGFGKSCTHNLQIIKRLQAFKSHDLPVLLGVSRKGFIGQILNKPVSERMFGGLSVALYAVMQGVKIIRTHDVDETKQVLDMFNRIILENGAN